jgi:hypothetical protein
MEEGKSSAVAGKPANPAVLESGMTRKDLLENNMKCTT